jgi:uncharacterized protein YjbI with pentapeptide repeats
MAKRQRSAVLNRLAGKKLVFNGRFSYGVEDALKAMAEAQQGTVCDDLDGKIDYLVLADLTAGKTAQKKALSLNGKGATIQVIDVDGFRNLAEPTDEEILALLRAGEAETFAKTRGPRYYHATTLKCTFHGEDFNAVTFKNAHLDDIGFEGCSFFGAKLDHVYFGAVTDCDFSRATGDSSHFAGVPNCRFNNSAWQGCRFTGDLSEADFSHATLDESSFANTSYYANAGTTKALLGVRFTNANLKSARFDGLHLKSPDFSGANLTEADFVGCSIDSGTFCNASLRNAVLVGCKLTGCDLTDTDLRGSNLAGADLTGAALAGADFKDANVRRTKLDGVNLSNAKNYGPYLATSGSVGPALTELDVLNAAAKRIQVTFRLRSSGSEDGEQVGIDSSGVKWGYGVSVPQSIARRPISQSRSVAFSDALLDLADIAGHRQVRFETVEVASTKSPTGGKELRDLVMRGIAEAFAQEIPAEEELAAAIKQHRAAEREKGAAERERREQAKAAAAKEKEKAKKQIAKKIKKTVGKVSDVASFLKALELRIEKPKIDKATKMLQASGFKLFNDVTDEHVSGVVKSQTDADLVYACRVAHDGQYACCTQNLNVCGGLRGSICKHLLVLITGLVQAGELDPTTIDAWIAKTHSVKPELDKEAMGAIFIKYKGAEAGEVDWRPTETVPEDYYTL